jgi:hypothetical protein
MNPLDVGRKLAFRAGPGMQNVAAVAELLTPYDALMLLRERRVVASKPSQAPSYRIIVAQAAS